MIVVEPTATISTTKTPQDDEDGLTDASEVDRLLYRGAAWTVAAFVLFHIAMPFIVPESEWQYCSELEQLASAMASTAMVMTTSFHFLPWMVRRRNGKRVSGVIVCTLVANGLALLTNLHFSFQKTPIVQDPVLGTRVFLMRWAEWTPLASFLTFLSEAVDLPKDPRKRWAPLVNSLLQSVACVCGSLFCFAPNVWVWLLLVCIALPTQVVMLQRLNGKYQAMRRTLGATTYTQKEEHDRRTFAYELIRACQITWGVLVILFFLNGLRARVFSSGFLGHPAWTMLVEIAFDVSAKGLYTKIVLDIHFDVFDSEKRAYRQLAELRRLMTVLWNSSSDVILITVRNGEKTTVMLSPSFVPFVGGGATVTGAEKLEEEKLEKLESSSVTKNQTTKGLTSLLLEFSPATSKDGEEEEEEVTARFVASDEIAGTDDVSLNTVGFLPVDSSSYVVKMARTLVELSWANNNNQDDNDINDDNNKGGGDQPSKMVGHSFQKQNGEECRCEIKVNHHSENSMAAVVRDVTERAKRYEAEQEAHQQALARQRDAQAVNRFTRHEVKNGLLASIELCDSLISATEDLYSQVQRLSAALVAATTAGVVADEPATGATTLERLPPHSGSSSSNVGEASSASDPDSHGPEESREAHTAVLELNSNLHEILETVLAEAMARDVIHEIYRPRLERLDLQSVLASNGVGKSSRFPLVSVKGPMPYVSSDPQLLKYIIRNAISNACKYGKDLGTIETHIWYDFNEGKLHMDISNEPGDGHEMLMAMGDEACRAVFEQGARLHSSIEASEQRTSSGDGAWIMKKCASVMGGSCEIKFEQRRTVFSFSCPASAVVAEQNVPAEKFKVPPGTWGIGIDDAKIQRKLLKQTLMHVGVKEERRIVTGSSPREVHNVEKIVKKTLKENPESKLFILVDENLDFRHSMKKDIVISGSRLMEDILRKLPPSMEERTLVLVRSANDSADDVADYCSRAHGFFPKAPLQPEGICGIVAPLWAGRFSESLTTTTTTTETWRRLSAGESGVEGLSADDLQQSLELVDNAVKDLSAGTVGWQQVWSALHSLKGDLMVIGVGRGNKASQDFREAITSIAQMRGPIQPVDFNKTWPTIRRSLLSAIEEF